ncbi:fatty-acid-binding protein 2 isoform X1 [Silene latifolia]|uniref:fatty-acid-binding protein 2 isoform X1 n=1 Tax=Silene latifolia TaxID=37657 RepID=UPI003D771FF1
MKNHSHFFIRVHHDGDPCVSSSNDPLLFNTFPVWYHVTSIVDHSKQLFLPQISKLATACLFWLSGASHIETSFPDNHSFRSPNPIFFTQFKRVSPTKHKLMGPSFSQPQSLAAFFFQAVSNFSVKHLFRKRDDAQLLPFLSVAAAIGNNLTSNMLAIPPADACVQMLGSVDQAPCDVQHRGRLGHSFPDFNWIRRAVEPITGIEFPGVLNNILAKENQSNLSPEVLVGTGSRTVTIIKIKSFKLYAFGFYVHPYSVCQKLGSKYASMPASELKDHNEFYADLLREDIGMTVRLVVNCNGMKINAVKDTFEKSLRARLVKTNPETDFKCIETFGSFFTKDIPLPVGTIIDLRRTADGQLITEIGGSQIGAVHSRELCRAFFDMYLGEVPVSKETKEEIGSNVASIVGRC